MALHYHLEVHGREWHVFEEGQDVDRNCEDLPMWHGSWLMPVLVGFLVH